MPARRRLLRYSSLIMISEDLLRRSALGASAYSTHYCAARIFRAHDIVLRKISRHIFRQAKAFLSDYHIIGRFLAATFSLYTLLLRYFEPLILRALPLLRCTHALHKNSILYLHAQLAMRRHFTA